MNVQKKRGLIIFTAIVSVIIMAAVLAVVSASYGKSTVASNMVASTESATSEIEENVVYFDFGNPGLLRKTNNYIGDAVIDGTQFYIRIIVEDKLWPYRDYFEIQVWNEDDLPYNIRIDKAAFYWKSGTCQECVTTDWVLKTGKCWYGPYYSDGTKEQKWAADYVEVNMRVLKGVQYGLINAKFYVGRTEVEML